MEDFSEVRECRCYSGGFAVCVACQWSNEIIVSENELRENGWRIQAPDTNRCTYYAVHTG